MVQRWFTLSPDLHPCPCAFFQDIVIRGSNFGFTALFSVAGKPCPVGAFGQSHTQFTCTLPPGQGMQQMVRASIRCCLLIS